MNKKEEEYDLYYFKKLFERLHKENPKIYPSSKSEFKIIKLR